MRYFPQKIGIYARILSTLYTRTLDRELAGHGIEDISGLQIRFMDFIRSRIELGKDIFQKDLEIEFCIRPPTATGILRTMEKNGLIERSASQQDGRLKKIVLTDKALFSLREFIRIADALDAQMMDCLTEKEAETLFMIWDKLIYSLKQKQNPDCYGKSGCAESDHTRNLKRKEK